MSQFNNYSEYYDLINSEKDYKSEVTYIDKLIKSINLNTKTILDVGCGTGKHIELLHKMGYQVEGIDLSDTMLQIAEKNYGSEIFFRKGDIKNFKLNKCYDTIISLFHVMSYQISNQDLESSFERVHEHLNPGGIFIFDCWHGPGVLSDLPSVRIKSFQNESIEITRISEPKIDFLNSKVEVDFKIFVNNLVENKLWFFEEKHNMRYLFYNEICFIADKFNFEIIYNYTWLTYDKPDEKTWQTLFALIKK